MNMIAVLRGPWQPIETAPKNETALFWVRPGTVGDGRYFSDTSGNPILGRGPAHIHIGKFATWSSLSIATHWMPMPPPPETEGDAK